MSLNRFYWLANLIDHCDLTYPGEARTAARAFHEMLAIDPDRAVRWIQARR